MADTITPCALSTRTPVGSTRLPTAATFVPSPTGFASDSNFKDIYGRFSYRFNLERDPASRNAVQAAGSSARATTPISTWASIIFMDARSSASAEKTSHGDPVVLTASEPFYRAGGDFSFNYRALNIYGVFMYGHDTNQLPDRCSRSPGSIAIDPPGPFRTGFVMDARNFHRRLCAGRLHGSSLVDRHHALGRGEFLGGPCEQLAV